MAKDLLDRVEVGGVGRKEHEAGAGALDGRPGAADLVGRQIVQDDDIARG